MKLPSKSVFMGALAFSAVMAIASLGLRDATVRAQGFVPEFPAPPSLKTEPIPVPDNLGDFVKDKAAAIRLGKALFWDMQVGSDGIQACATCHFHAGADSRLKNQLDPGLRAVPPDSTFQIGGPNYTLVSSDFPFHKLADPNDRHSAVLRDTNDIVSSQGVFSHAFVDFTPGFSNEVGTRLPDPIFNVKGLNVRRVEPRNTPTMINAVFNLRNFWDGRAQNDFNGVNPFGSRDPNARVLCVIGGVPQQIRISLQHASLASQADGPPGSDFESSFAGRPFAKIGKKLICDGMKLGPLKPLGKQLVDRNDSVLGPLAGTRINPSRRGLETTYREMIQAAFQDKWWNSNKVVTFNRNGNINVMNWPNRLLTTSEFSVMEANLSLFWGLAIQCYESTLVSDDAPYDRFQEGNQAALTAQQKQGLALFTGKAECINCHNGPEFSAARISHTERQPTERMPMGDGHLAVYDEGFYNIGVRPSNDDVGVGGTDPFGNPLSFARMAQLGKFVDPSEHPPVDPNERVAVMGNFKVPTLRNVELTGPYFHNGGQATLMQVVEFYNRGGDFADENRNDLDTNIERLNLTTEEKAALVAFLKSLTDPRVRMEKAPFDHPELFVPNGHPGNQFSCVDDGTGQATDQLMRIPPCGAGGSSGLSPVFPQGP